MPVKILFYANASPDIGAGHVMRLFAIAQMFYRHAYAVSFVYHTCPAVLQDKLQGAGFSLMQHAKDLPRVLQDANADIIIVDDYYLDASDWQIIRQNVPFVAVMDDKLNDQAIDADLIINPAADATYEEYRMRNAKADLCLGPQFSVLREEFAKQAQGAFLPLAERSQILVTLGGADVKNMAGSLSRALLQALQSDEFTDVESDSDGATDHLAKLRNGSSEYSPPRPMITLLLGGLSAKQEADMLSLQTLAAESNDCLQIVQNSQQVATLMSSAGLAISAAGGTLGELASMGVPTIALVSVDNQMGALRSPLLDTWYQAVDVRAYSSNVSQEQSNQLIIQDIVLRACTLWRDLCKRESMSKMARQFVDTKGTWRIMQAIEQSSQRNN